MPESVIVQCKVARINIYLLMDGRNHMC